MGEAAGPSGLCQDSAASLRRRLSEGQGREIKAWSPCNVRPLLWYRRLRNCHDYTPNPISTVQCRCSSQEVFVLLALGQLFGSTELGHTGCGTAPGLNACLLHGSHLLVEHDFQEAEDPLPSGGLRRE